MENLNAETVKRGLECCMTGDSADCKKCYRHPLDTLTTTECMEGLIRDALALINSQEQRIKELAEENERLLARNFDLAEKGEKVVIAYKKLSEENEKLLNHYFIDTTIGSGTSRQNCIKETVQNYREGLHKEFASLGAKDKFNKAFFLEKADQIAKEMLEGNNDT